MRNLLWITALLLLMIPPALAQEESTLCAAPFVTDAADSDLVLSVNGMQVTAEMFANRFRFEHAYNAIKYEIRVVQINQQAAAFEMDAAPLMASDPQIQQISQENDMPQQLASRVLQELADDAILWQYAAESDFSVSAEDFEAKIDDFFAIDDQSPEERDAIVNNFSQLILTAGTDPSELTIFFCRQLVFDFVQSLVITDTDTALFVDADHILLSSQDLALDIITLLENGDDFATLAQDLSLDVGSGQRGGALGWQPLVLFVQPFAEALLNGEVGTILAPVETQFGWHVIRLNGREIRPVEEDQRDLIISSRFAQWRREQRGESTLILNPDWQSFIPDL